MFFPVAAQAELIIDINSLIPSSGEGITYINGFNSYKNEVTYEKKNGLSIFEGDIILTTTQEAENWRLSHEKSSTTFGTRSVIRTGERYRWVNNLMPYEFASNVSDNVKTMFIQAMAHWEDNTEIRFVERNSSNASLYPDYVSVVENELACYSYVGRIGGKQLLNVVSACGFGATVHEIGHAAGLWHEQSREDRDSFVQINSDNIQDGKENNFQQQISGGDDIGTYDYGSIMHYGAYAFSKNGLTTIDPIQTVEIGQRLGLSELDIASILQHYPASASVKQWNKMTSESAKFIKTVDFDNDGQLDLVGSFSSGTWINRGAEWEKLTSETAISLEFIDTDSNGQLEIIGNFRSGVWLYDDLQGWFSKLTSETAHSLQLVDLNNDGVDVILGDFPSGVYIYDNNQWDKLTSESAKFIKIIDFDNDGQLDLVGSFSSGTWIHRGAEWEKLSPQTAISLDFIDINNDGQLEIIGNFRSGVWLYDDQQGWFNKLSSETAHSLQFVDLNNDGVDVILGDFPSGVYIYDNNQWIKMSSESAHFIKTVDFDNDGQLDLVGSFSSGTWIHRGAEWEKLTPQTAISLDFVDTNNDGQLEIIGNFRSGVWLYDDQQGWFNKLSSESALSIKVVDLDNDGVDEVLGNFGSGTYLYE